MMEFPNISIIIVIIVVVVVDDLFFNYFSNAEKLLFIFVKLFKKASS